MILCSLESEPDSKDKASRGQLVSALFLLDPSPHAMGKLRQLHRQVCVKKNQGHYQLPQLSHQLTAITNLFTM